MVTRLVAGPKVDLDQTYSGLEGHNRPRRFQRRLSRRRFVTYELIAVIVFLGIWQLSELLLDPMYASTPWLVAKAFVNLVFNLTLANAFFVSAWQMVGGFLLAAFIGISIGILMGRSTVLDKSLEPFVSFGNSTPGVAIVPVLVVWFGINGLSSLMFIVAITIWPMLVNTLAGIKSMQHTYGDVGAAFRLKGLRLTWEVTLPAAMPYILVGARVALAQAAVGMILGGQEIGSSGLGGLAGTFGDQAQTADLIATIILSTGLALLTFWLLRRFQGRFYPWIAELADNSE